MRSRIRQAMIPLACIILAAGAWTTPTRAVEIGQFFGGDPGEGLDLQGDFLYAVDIAGSENRKVGDALFTRDSRTTGFSIVASDIAASWATPEYGDTENDTNLERTMRGIRWSNVLNPTTPTVDITMDVVKGEKYKLQMLFTESCCDRAFDILMEDEMLVDDFVIFNYHVDQTPGIASRSDGVVIWQEFTAGDSQLSLILGMNAPDHPDNNGHISALTLERLTPAVPGDFDGNTDLDVADIDALSAAVAAGTNVSKFDLNGDAKVDTLDRTKWVSELKKTWFGDANMDLQFTSADFVLVFSAGEYEDEIAGNSGWADGDWNGDGDFNSTDFVIAFTDGGYEAGPRAAVSAVPEPSASWSLGLVVLRVIRRRRSTKV